MPVLAPWLSHGFRFRHGLRTGAAACALELPRPPGRLRLLSAGRVAPGAGAVLVTSAAGPLTSPGSAPAGMIPDDHGCRCSLLGTPADYTFDGMTSFTEKTPAQISDFDQWRARTEVFAEEMMSACRGLRDEGATEIDIIGVLANQIYNATHRCPTAVRRPDPENFGLATATALVVKMLVDDRDGRKA